MAAMASLKTWCRLSKVRGISRTVCKVYYSSDVVEKERILDRMKKYVFGEEAPPKETEDKVDSYYQLAKVQDPLVYSMETHQIVDKVEDIVTEALPGIGDRWQNGSVSNLIVKYKVLSRCYEEFGLLVPNYQLNEMNTVRDIIQFYTSAKPKDMRTFRSIDMDNLPPNLTIGGTVPRRVVSP